MSSDVGSIPIAAPETVPLENLEMSEQTGLYFFHTSRRCSIFPLTTLLATLSSIFRSRAALALENLALRHQIGVLQRSARKTSEIDGMGPPVVDLSVPPLA